MNDTRGRRILKVDAVVARHLQEIAKADGKLSPRRLKAMFPDPRAVMMFLKSEGLLEDATAKALLAPLITPSRTKNKQDAPQEELCPEFSDVLKELYDRTFVSPAVPKKRTTFAKKERAIFAEES